MSETLELWRLPKVCEKTGLGKSSIWDMVKNSLFPEPRRIGAQAVAWRSDEVLAWMQACPPAGSEPEMVAAKEA